jgi:hypothetical protein
MIKASELTEILVFISAAVSRTTSLVISVAIPATVSTKTELFKNLKN